MVGPNGSGKSTAMRCITGADRPTEGTVELDGTPMDERLPAIRRGLAVVMDDLDFFPDLSVVEHLDLFARAHGVPNPDALVDAVLADVGLTMQAAQLPGTLSSGQRRRLALAGDSPLPAPSYDHGFCSYSMSLNSDSTTTAWTGWPADSTPKRNRGSASCWPATTRRSSPRLPTTSSIWVHERRARRDACPPWTDARMAQRTGRKNTLGGNVRCLHRVVRHPDARRDQLQRGATGPRRGHGSLQYHRLFGRAQRLALGFRTGFSHWGSSRPRCSLRGFSGPRSCRRPRVPGCWPHRWIARPSSARDW